VNHIMPDITVNVVLPDIKKIETDALIVGFFEDVRPLKGFAGELDWVLCGALSKLILQHKVKGAKGESALLTTQGKLPAQKIFMIGLGKKSDFTEQAMQSAAKTAVMIALKAGSANAAIEYFAPVQETSDRMVTAFLKGLKEGADGRMISVSLLAPNRQVYDGIGRLLQQGMIG